MYVVAVIYDLKHVCHSHNMSQVCGTKQLWTVLCTDWWLTSL